MNSIFFLRSFSSRLITQFVYIFLPYKRKYHGFKFYRAFSTLDYPRTSALKLNVNIEFLKITTSEPLPLQHECDHEILEISTQEILHNVTRTRNWVLILFWTSQQQCQESRVQCGQSRVQHPESSVQHLSRSRKSSMSKKP